MQKREKMQVPGKLRGRDGRDVLYLEKAIAVPRLGRWIYCKYLLQARPAAARRWPDRLRRMRVWSRAAARFVEQDSSLTTPGRGA
jgi:hypothetical protein